MRGGGLEHGQPAFHGYEQAKQFLHRQGQHQAANDLTRVVAGGSSFGSRFELNTACRFCQQALETPEHVYYNCEAATAFAKDDWAVSWRQKTAWLAKKGAADSFQPPCLWARGLIPKSWSHDLIDSFATDYTMALGDCEPHAEWAAATDGAGPAS